MLRRASEIIGCDIVSTDGVAGHVYDLLFDEDSWQFRFLVVDIGNWFKGRRLVVSFDVVEEIDEGQRKVCVPLSKDDIEKSPSMSTQSTVEAEAEALLGKVWMWTPNSAEYIPPEVRRILETEATVGEKLQVEDSVKSHLRSFRETDGYHIAASDGDIGHLRDLLADVDTQVIKYLAINAGNWLLQRNVVVPAAALESIHWADQRVHLSLKCEEVRHSPEYDPDEPVAHAYEQALQEHYGN
jgi:uncharacterized protein YrrD